MQFAGLFYGPGCIITPNLGYISWDRICSSKKSGGLGVRNIILWNKVAVGKMAWHVAQKTDNLWVKWVHTMYIKDQNWQEYRAPVYAS